MSISLLIGVFSSFRLKIIIDMLVLESTILLFVFYWFPLVLILFFLSCLHVNYFNIF